jgi:hypothetical protein
VKVLRALNLARGHYIIISLSLLNKYVPKKVHVPRSARVKGAPGRQPTKLPDWCSRKHQRWPPQAMAEALELLRPAEEKPARQHDLALG